MTQEQDTMPREHTPTPWRVVSRTAIYGNDEWRVAELYPNNLAPINAERIVRAVNCHDDLLEALDRLDTIVLRAVQSGWLRLGRGTSDDEFNETMRLVRAALTKAKATS